MPRGGRVKAALTNADKTAETLTTLVESKSDPPTAAPEGVFSHPETSASATNNAAPPPAVAKILDGPVAPIVASVFEANPDKEFTVNAVIEELKKSDPGINENSIRFTVTELKRKSVIHHVRNEGHYQYPQVLEVRGGEAVS